uniref:Pentatricopeptide repeat-containing protein n=1 Tax=Chenopodium quinoa TaxID=63459 RepID=A0A803NAB8_CHEQI
MEWDYTNIRDWFVPSDAFAILASEDPDSTQEDFRYRASTPSGRYSVKTGYAMLQQQRSLEATHSSFDSFWKVLWSLQLQPKWKLFLWKLLHRALAVKVELYHRGVPVQDVSCDLCHSEPEDLQHLFRIKYDLTYYAEIASKLVDDGLFDDFVRVVERVLSSDATGSLSFGTQLNSKLVVSGVIKGLRQGRIKDVIELLGYLLQLNVTLLKMFDGSTMELLKKECFKVVEEGYLLEAVELMEMLAGFQISIKDLIKPSEMIKISIDKRSPSLAVRYACLLPQAEILFCTMIKEFGKRSDLVSAVEVFEASKQKLSGHNMYVYRTIIDICGLCGDCIKSRLIYEDLLAQKVTPNIYVFNSLMNVNAHDLTYTMEVYKQMQSMGVEVDMTSYNILLKACCLSGRVDLAQDIYREVLHLESTGAIKIDVFTYSTIIKVFADAKLWQMAIKIKEDMLSAGVTPNTVTWSSLISACANGGLVDQATQLFEEMLMAGCQPKFTVFQHTSSCLCGGMSIMKSMVDSGIRPDVVAYTTAIKVTYNTLLRARTKYGSLQEVQQCLAIYQDMREAGYKSNDYYLKLLIEEWCEGVIQGNNLQGLSYSRNKADLGEMRSQILERVATHLRKNTVKSLAVDIQGLTKVEARLVVLAALRMIKENYKSGCSVKDDLTVIIGITKVGVRCMVRDAIENLLKKELGLEVIAEDPGMTIDRTKDKESASNLGSNSRGAPKMSDLPNSLDTSARRPAVLQRLLVPRKSLNHWLQRSDAGYRH